MWKELDTLGTLGSEEGIIKKDEEYCDSARITLETCSRNSEDVYAITCGIYGAMVHTVYGNKETISDTYESMKAEIQQFIDNADNLSEDEWDDFIEKFTRKF